MSWEPGFSCATRFAGRELFVGEWRCAGDRKSASREETRHVEIGLLHSGAHLRAVGARRGVVDPTVATLNRAGDEVVMTSPAAPQRSTALLVRGALGDEVARAIDARFARVSPAAARLHARLVHAGDPLAIEETALALVAQVLADARGAAPAAGGGSPGQRRLAEEIQHLLATRYAERLTVEEIAAACGVSPFYASRAFRAVTGGTIHRHLMRVRLHVAALQLGRAAGRIAELALAVGWTSHSHFTAAYRRELGHLPSEQL